MRFSERMGYKSARVEIQLESMDRDLRIGLFNAFHLQVIRKGQAASDFVSLSPFSDFIVSFWGNFLKEPIDKVPNRLSVFGAEVRKVITTGPWHEVYDLIEFSVDHLPGPYGRELETLVNPVLERELSGYRLISGKFAPITNTIEIESIESALNHAETLNSTQVHLDLALDMLSNRTSPDYRNSIKESISAVEAMAKDLTGDPKATLGGALSEIERHGHMHPALKKGLTSLYGYTSDADGIRHALMEESKLTSSDARFMLVACSAFINYMVSKKLDA